MNIYNQMKENCEIYLEVICHWFSILTLLLPIFTFFLNISFMFPITENILFQTYDVSVEFYNENIKVNESDSWPPMKS